MTTAISGVSVIVPARDEERRISRCLDALHASVRHLHTTVISVPVTITVVLDCCRDATARIARAHGVHTLSVDTGAVGAARDVGVRNVLHHIDIHPNEHWLAITDADSTVPPEWLATHVSLARRGAGVVTGLVRPDDALAPRLWRRWSDAHPIRAGHPHVYGANLGIRGDIYQSAGGFPAVRSGEDQALVTAAIGVGATITATDEAIVTTSSRRIARAPHGFADWLHQHDVPTA